MAPLILYNTLMGLAASVSLLLLVVFPQKGATASLNIRQSWAVTFGGLGGLLVVLSLHMVLVWPLMSMANLVFGEPSLLFGVLLIIAAIIIYRTPVDESVVSEAHTDEDRSELRSLWNIDNLPTGLNLALRPVSYVGALGGVMVILLGWATGVIGEVVWRAPPNEWPTGLVAGTGIEPVFMTATYTILGVGAILIPFGLHNPSRLETAGRLLTIAGILLLIITMISFIGHVSLSVGAPPGGIPWPP